MDCRIALLTILDQVDYTNGACNFTEMVGAVLPKEVILLARKAIADADKQSADECLCSSDKKHNWKDYTMVHVVLCEWCGTRRVS